jgi:biotin carboxylase
MPEVARFVDNNQKVLVVGTTADYIEWIRRSCPGRALFLTDPVIRHQAREPSPRPAEEILCDLSDYELARVALKRHLQSENLSLDGITSYDCESMELAAVLAQDFDLPYPAVEAIGNCRDKRLSKLLWHQKGLRCPHTRLVQSGTEAVNFFKEIGAPCVIKPLRGSGSELIFRCDCEDECRNNFREISIGLLQRRFHPLYRSSSEDSPLILAEEFVTGEEFSCDFMIENGRVELIRLSRKILSKEGPFGTTRSYILPAALPAGVDLMDFKKILHESAKALGILRAICMLDFIIRESEIFLLEIAPRPGGDCLPFLLRRCWDLDIIKLNLDLAQQRPVRLCEPANAHPCIGLRLHARHGGILKKINVKRLRKDPRVRELHLLRKPNHIIRMPPADYDSWLLGHIIFLPFKDIDLETQCNELLDQIAVEIE